MAMNTRIFDLTYLDHSSNRYRFWRSDDDQPAGFVYDPVRPEHSSSGVYSGGSRGQGELSQQRVEELLGRVRTLEAATELHADQRQKGTGSFRLREADSDGRLGDERRFLLRNGAHRREFEDFLEPFRRPG